MSAKRSKRVLQDIAKAIEIFPKIVARNKRAAKHQQAVLKRFAPFSHNLALDEMMRSSKNQHPWRLCPSGQHWVASHPMHVQVSPRNPSGLTVRDGHCRINPSGKDQLYADEMMRIAENHFAEVRELPSANSLGFSRGNDFDILIGGWTRYWNEVLKPQEPLDPNLIKALISTESSFKIEPKKLASKGNWARGLMQVTDETLAILRDENGELKNFFVHIDQADANDPNLNISAGIRWLFHKKHLLERRKKRAVTWTDAIMDYKAYTKDLKLKKKKAMTQKAQLLERYEVLKND